VFLEPLVNPASRREAGEVVRNTPSDLSNVADTLERGPLAAHRAVFRLAQELSLEHPGTVDQGGGLLD